MARARDGRLGRRRRRRRRYDPLTDLRCGRAVLSSACSVADSSSAARRMCPVPSAADRPPSLSRDPAGARCGRRRRDKSRDHAAPGRGEPRGGGGGGAARRVEAGLGGAAGYGQGDGWREAGLGGAAGCGQGDGWREDQQEAARPVTGVRRAVRILAPGPSPESLATLVPSVLPDAHGTEARVVQQGEREARKVEETRVGRNSVQKESRKVVP